MASLGYFNYQKSDPSTHFVAQGYPEMVEGQKKSPRQLPGRKSISTPNCRSCLNVIDYQLLLKFFFTIFSEYLPLWWEFVF